MKVVVTCQNCSQKIGLPDDKKTLIFTCPSCKKKWKWNNPKFNTIKSNKNITVEMVRNYVRQLRGFKPKVAIIGKSGVGKSSFINALFKSSVSKVSHVDTGTTDVKEFNFEGITILDFPGLADLSKENEKHFEQLYKNKLQDVDLAIWVMAATDRANSPDKDAYDKYLKPQKDRMPTMIVLSKSDGFCDSPNPMDDWNYSSNNFGPKNDDIKNKIEEKRRLISKEFCIPLNYIEAIAIKTKNEKYFTYNLDNLVQKIVTILPKEKKFSFVRECNNDNVTDNSKIEAEKGIWDSVKEFAGDAWDKVKDAAGEIITATAIIALKKIFRWFA